MGDRFEQLLVAAASLACLLVQVERRRLIGLDQRLYEAQQSGLALVPRVELLRQRDLVEAEPGVARGALEQLLRVVVPLELRHAQANALLGLQRQGSVAELRT